MRDSWFPPVSIARLQYSGRRKDQCRQASLTAAAVPADAYGKACSEAFCESNPPVPMTDYWRVPLQILIGTAIALGLSPLARKADAAESYAIAMHGAPALPAGFAHMPYANPDAPTGGRLVWGFLGTFDSLNPLIV
ncbi:MAG: hypothetical protein PS018_05195, partial [bacterium]|nr:hypothetical protein [bacterium]